MAVYFTSDPHYWHNNVIRYCSRPYISVEEMNEDMILKWNSIVRPEDTVYILGDFSLAFRPVELYSKRLMGTKYLIPGNHDMCHSYHKRSKKEENRKQWISKYEEQGLIVLPEQTTLDIPGLATFNLCHHPYAAPSNEAYDDKYAKWRPVDDGRILLCGHIHEKWKTNKSSKGTLMINVGVDVNNFTPISIDQIKELINQQSQE